MSDWVIVTKKQKVLVWLSWWVDSAVSAFLLMQKGYDVIAGFMKNYANESNPHCHTRQDRDMAIQVAQHLGIKTFIIFDFRQEYQERIIQYIIDWYQSGITPNPDVLCNSEIKFKIFLQHAISLWCEYVATGHYANSVSNTWEIKNQESDSYFDLYRWIDHNKDQSYFLAWLDQYQLSHSLFPLWWLTKSQVREIARDIGLPNADRPDSQWLCFIGNVPIKSFLKQYLPVSHWLIKTVDGNIIGKHDGIYYYTIWQRHGLGLNTQNYVIDIDSINNEIIVWPKEAQERQKKKCNIWPIHWINHSYDIPLSCQAKIRYRQDPIPVHLTMIESNICCTFDIPQIWVAPGQILVLYDGEKCIGSSIIQRYYDQ
jgi:tRNA-specific 2-thiouridylase